MQGVIESAQNKIDFLRNEDFSPAEHGTKHHVFISQNYALRARKERFSQEVLKREADFLERVANPLAPKVLWRGLAGGEYVVIENRLPGERLSKVWHNLAPIAQERIIQDLIDFMRNLKRAKSKKIYSVKSGKQYPHFYDYLIDKIDRQNKINQFPAARPLKKRLESAVLTPRAREVFDEGKISLVHGDLLIHNLITDQSRLAGVVDWETAMFGDPDFEICRLVYYQELARSYYDRGRDEIFECDFISKLLSAVSRSDLMPDPAKLRAKYSVIRSIFYLDALCWAAGSDRPEENIRDIEARLESCPRSLAFSFKCGAR